jgi:hypothetical protein
VQGDLCAMGLRNKSISQRKIIKRAEIASDLGGEKAPRAAEMCNWVSQARANGAMCVMLDEFAHFSLSFCNAIGLALKSNCKEIISDRACCAGL